MAEHYNQSVEELEPVLNNLPFLVTPFLKKRVEEGSYSAQAFRQFMPNALELLKIPGYISDPNDEASKIPESAEKLIQAYEDRALLMLTLRCFVYCRFCFRRDAVGQGKPISHSELVKALDFLRSHKEIEDVVISGGDPFATPPRLFMSAIQGLCAIPNIRKVRIHTRAVNTSPATFDDTLVNFLPQYGSQIDIYTHMNHPDDIDYPEVKDCIKRIRKAGITIYNQGVFLGGVNDSPDIQVRLSKLLYWNGVVDYARFLPDPAAGTAHFDVSDERIIDLTTALSHISGPAQPQIVYVNSSDQKERCHPGGLEKMKNFLEHRKVEIGKMVAKKPPVVLQVTATSNGERGKEA
jgi:lysine 2,3-aminomutase